MITHDTPNSSNIARLSYDDEKGNLMIEFRSGKMYRYYDVPMEIWTGLISADSVGRFFNSNIRGKFKEEQV
jgi:hypothetical protein